MRRSLAIFASVLAAAIVVGLLFSQPTVSQVPARPNPPPGRFHVQPLYNGGLIYIDSATGKLWYGTINADTKDAWTTIAPPVDEPK